VASIQEWHLLNSVVGVKVL